MSQTCDHIDLIIKARHGDKESLHRLAVLAEPRLREFVYRVTLQQDLTQDIVQESLLEMLRIIDKLRDNNRFWYWLYGIAMNKIRRHQQQRYRRRMVSLSDVDVDQDKGRGDQTVANVVGRELRDIVVRCMEQLDPRHRTILTMRCYNQMPYSEIANLMGCTEFGARALFYRAKKSLARKLSGYGFGKGAMLAGLLIFGKMTARSKAVAANLTIPAETLHVGVAASAAAIATTKTAIISIAAAGVVTTSTVMVPMIQKESSVEQDPQSIPAVVQNIPMVPSHMMYYFPDSTQGPMMLRTRPLSDEDPSHWHTMQNAEGNYIWEDNRIIKTNNRYWNENLSVTLLPTDPPEFIEFVCMLTGQSYGIEHTNATGKGLMVMASAGEAEVRISHHLNALHEDYFQLDPPVGVAWDDQRDTMHRRGWTYFKVEGQIQGRIISGQGRIPFVYTTYQSHCPWLNIKIGRLLQLADSENGAFLRNNELSQLKRFSAGTFFQGLSRPWMGLHTLDTIRRDAARQRISFQTEITPDKERVRVDLLSDPIRLEYTIHLRTDLVERIVFFHKQDQIGTLRFIYLQEANSSDRRFYKPRLLGTRGPQSDVQGSLWLIRLADGSLMP